MLLKDLLKTKFKVFIKLILFILSILPTLHAQDVKVDLNTKEKLSLGVQYYNQGNFSASKEEFTLYLKSKEKEFDRYSNEIIEAEFYVILCDFYLNPLRTRASIDRFISIYPTSIKTQILINKVGDYFYKAGYFQDAIEYLELKKDLKTPADNFKLAISYYKIDDKAKALQLFELLQEEKNDTNIALISSYYASVLNYSKKNYKFYFNRLKSIDDSTDKIDNLPISEEAWAQIQYNIPKLIVSLFYCQGETKYDSLLNYIEPKLYDKTLEFDKKEVAKLVGDIQFQKEMYAKAAKSYNIYNELNDGIKNDKNQFDYKEAFALHKSKNYHRSIEKFNDFLNYSKSDSLNQVASFLIADSYYQIKNYSKALEYFNLTIIEKLDHDLNEEAGFRILSSLYFLNDFDKILNLSQSFVNNNPETKYRDQIMDIVSLSIIKLEKIDTVKELLNINHFKNDKIHLAYRNLALKLYKYENAKIDKVNYSLSRSYLNEALKYTTIESEKIKTLYFLAKTYFQAANDIEKSYSQNRSSNIDSSFIRKKQRDINLKQALVIFNSYKSTTKNIDTIDFVSDLLKLNTLYKLGLNPQQQFELGNRLLSSSLCEEQNVSNILNILYLNVKETKSVDFYKKLLILTNNIKKAKPLSVDFYV